MTVALAKPLFVTDTDIRVNVAALSLTQDTLLKVSIKENDEEYGIIYIEQLLIKNGKDIVISVPISGLTEAKEYTIKAELVTDTTVSSNEVIVKTKDAFLQRYKTNVGAVFQELTKDGTLYRKMVDDMQTELDKYTFDDFERAQILAQYMAQITTGITSEASRTALSIAEKEKSSAKNGELLGKQIEKINKEIELEQTQIQSTKDSVQHNLLIKLLGGQENYALAMAGNTIIPTAAMHTNYYLGVKEGYRWAGFTYTENNELVGVDGKTLGAFETSNLAESTST